MYVRVVRFTGVSPERIEEIRGRMNESDGPPVESKTTGVKMMVDESQGTAVVLQQFETAEDMEEGARAFAAMDASETPGTRASVDSCEVLFEMEASAG